MGGKLKVSYDNDTLILSIELIRKEKLGWEFALEKEEKLLVRDQRCNMTIQIVGTR